MGWYAKRAARSSQACAFIGAVAHAYAARLNVQDRDGLAPANPLEVAEVLSQWAGVALTWADSHATGSRGAAIRTELLQEGEGASAIWRLTYELDDRVNDGTRWSVTATVLADIATEAVIVLDRSLVGDAFVRPPLPKPPGCIPALISSEGLCCVDAGRVLSTDVWGVSEAAAEEFAEVLMAPDRRLPVVGFTGRDDDVFDGGLLLQELIGIAHVVFIGSPTSRRLDTLLPAGLNVYGGAVRLWWPRLDAAARRWDHPLWPADVPARRIAGTIHDELVAAALAVSAIDARVIAADRHKAERDLAALRQRVTEMEGHEVDFTLIDELVENYEAEARAALDRAFRAESDRDYWKGQFEDIRRRETAGTVASNPIVEFSNEITAEVTGRGEVDGATNRLYGFGRTFLESVAQHGDRYHQKIVKTCADVVMGAPALLKRCDDHPLRGGEGANDPVTTRSHDGAEARRCYIESNTPAARRLHYWLLPDNLVEFASVNVHDDVSIPE